MGTRLGRRAFASGFMSAAALVATGTQLSAQEGTPQATGGMLRISAIPDQEVAVLNRQLGAMADYLADAAGLEVEYVPMVDYAALVTAFARGDIHLAWFGGLTGVQAQAAAPGT
jgi:phosphonate transport system substrate-binding protein